jgi:hypothetical protein
MSLRVFRIIFVVVLGITLVASFFPYQRFNVPIEYSTVIRTILAGVVLGMGVKYAQMFRSTFSRILIVIGNILFVSVFFPYQGFNIAIEYPAIVQIILALVLLGMSVRLLVHGPGHLS